MKLEGILGFRPSLDGLSRNVREILWLHTYFSGGEKIYQYRSPALSIILFPFYWLYEPRNILMMNNGFWHRLNAGPHLYYLPVICLYQIYLYHLSICSLLISNIINALQIGCSFSPLLRWYWRVSPSSSGAMVGGIEMSSRWFTTRMAKHWSTGMRTTTSPLPMPP